MILQHSTPSSSGPRARTATRRAFALLLGVALLESACTLASTTATPAVVIEPRADPSDPHAEALGDALYPSAETCRTCHPGHYREWSVSPHAYTQISPVFNAMNGTLLRKTSGTLGDFCIRCHTPVGMALGEPLFASHGERAPVSMEGVTCVVCHRVNRDYGKVSARTSILPGALEAPVYGPRDGSEQERVEADPETYGKLITDPEGTGRRIHAEGRYFAPITTASTCATCHEILLTGFREDESVSEYKRSPAAARGETCQDCHMGATPGVAAGYRTEPAAEIGGVPTAPAKRTDHMFLGPDTSIVHPGIFPHNPEARALATLEEWLAFDHAAGWGTDAFEDTVDEDASFPERWAWPEDRYDARDVIDEQLALIAEAREGAIELLRAGFELSEIRSMGSGPGLAFEVDVRNATDGHNVPTGFIGERVVFLAVTVEDAAGEVVFRSGDLDPNGDLRDRHSLYVQSGALPLDRQLFTLTSTFMTRNVHGSERPHALAANVSLDPLPFVRPDPRPTTLLGRKLGARIHKRTIEPGGRRTARYAVPAVELGEPGEYTVRVRLVVASVAVHLIDAIADVGFDYGLSPRAVADGIRAGHLTVRERLRVLEVR